MISCFFVSDMHGKIDRYEKLFTRIIDEKPAALFLGGDLLPHRLKNLPGIDDFVMDYLTPSFMDLKNEMDDEYPRVFLILGNDDARSEETKIAEVAGTGLWEYIHFRSTAFHGFTIFGYSYVPPTPFQLKDWEKYDVSRFVDPGCIHPNEGFRTVDPMEDIDYGTIKKDLEILTGEKDLSKSIFLFHTPPYKTLLDRAGLDGMMVDHVPLDVHVGSIAVQRFIEERKPYLTMHGHIHESTRLTGEWRQDLNGTSAFNAAHDGSELCIVTFDLENPGAAKRELI
ncbi:MAG: hypothetical protein JXA03_04095 [Bacteroidales bacterium]|nr:hypothetical protein [Bacteroidales bacterium]